MFDLVKLDRVKVTDRFAFPLELHSSALMPPPDGDVHPSNQKDSGRNTATITEAHDVVYDLDAILVHKGASALHGHYVAHIKVGEDQEGRGGQWWRFDDENADCMPKGPLSSNDHGPVTASKATSGAATGSAKKRKGRKKEGVSDKETPGAEKKCKTGDNADDKRPSSLPIDSFEGVVVHQEQGNDSKAVHHGSEQIMTDASAQTDAADLKGEQEDGCSPAAGSVYNASKKGMAAIQSSASRGISKDRRSKIESTPKKSTAELQGEPGSGKQSKEQKERIISNNAYLLLYRRRDVSLTGVQLCDTVEEWIRTSRQEFRNEFELQSRNYLKSKEEVEVQTLRRREEVRSAVEASMSKPDGDPGCFIALDWLHKWADGDGTVSVPPIDNAPLLCPHGRLDPSKISLSRRLPTHVFAQLVDRHRGGPELGPSDTCSRCLQQRLAEVIAREDSEEARERYVKLAAALEIDQDAVHDRASALHRQNIVEMHDVDGQLFTVDGHGALHDADASVMRLMAGDDRLIHREHQSGRNHLKKNSLGSGAHDRPQYYVSKSWLGAWRRRLGKTMGMSSPIDAITCPHGDLLPEIHSKTARRIAIPQDFWEYLQRNWAATVAMRDRRLRMRAAKGCKGQQRPTGVANPKGDDHKFGEPRSTLEQGNSTDGVTANTYHGVEVNDVVVLTEDSDDDDDHKGYDSLSGRPHSPSPSSAVAGSGSGVNEVDEEEHARDTKAIDKHVLCDKGFREEHRDHAEDQVDLTDESSSAGMLRKFLSGTSECSKCLKELKTAEQVRKI